MTMLRIRDLHKYYGSFHAVRGISFDVERGEIIGFLGPNGAGKTTTMKIVTGFMSMSAGEVAVNGHDVVEDSLSVRSSIGYLPEHAPLYEDVTVREYLNFICEVRGLKGAKKAERIRHVIGVCSLASKERAGIRTLSKGFRQRVGLAQAIIHEPELVILDEPTVGLDPNQIIEIRELIREIGEKNTVILSSHILSEVEVTCDRVLIVNEGYLVAEGSSEELVRDHQTKRGFRLQIKTSQAEADVRAAVEKLSGVSAAKTLPGNVENKIRLDLDCASNEDFLKELRPLMATHSWELEELSPHHTTLEDVFKSLTAPANDGLQAVSDDASEEAAVVVSASDSRSDSEEKSS